MPWPRRGPGFSGPCAAPSNPARAKFSWSRRRTKSCRRAGLLRPSRCEPAPSRERAACHSRHSLDLATAPCNLWCMRRRFVTLDVFTSRRLTGNPLAVVLDPEGLARAVMQAVAGECHLSETVFVRPPAAPAHRAKLRFFTPARELPFAGHPTVGTAVLLARLDGGVTGEIVLEEAIGPVRCDV